MARTLGTYQLPNGQPVVAGTTISDTVFNTLTADIANEITNSIPRDGTAPPTANLPMGNFKITGLGNGTVATDAAAFGQLTATNTVNTPAGNISSTTVQAALNELDTEKAPAAPFIDSTALLKGSVDATKLVKFEVDGLTTATTRTVTVPDANFTLAQDGLVVHNTGNETIAGIKTFSSMPVLPAQSMIRLNTANGYGSTNTRIRRFTNVVTNQGSDITYADSATLGASFTINTNGVYAISYSDNFSVAGSMGISLNSSQLTTDIFSLTASDLLAAEYQGISDGWVNVAITAYLTSSSVIRPHCGTAASGTHPQCQQFTITRVA